MFKAAKVKVVIMQNELFQINVYHHYCRRLIGALLLLLKVELILITLYAAESLVNFPQGINNFLSYLNLY